MSIDKTMPAFRHTWLFEPGAWSAAGRFWDEGQFEREARGTSIIRHTDDVWEIKGSMEFAGEPPVTFHNDYRIAAPGEDARILPWQSDNPAIGRLTGVFFVAGDTIMSSFQSSEGGFVGSEHMTCLAPDRYRARGLFLRSGAIVSAWSMGPGAAEMNSRRQESLRTAEYFQERAARADVDKALELLERAGDEPPREGDEIVSDVRRPRRSRRSPGSARRRR